MFHSDLKYIKNVHVHISMIFEIRRYLVVLRLMSNNLDHFNLQIESESNPDSIRVALGGGFGLSRGLPQGEVLIMECRLSVLVLSLDAGSWTLGSGCRIPGRSGTQDHRSGVLDRRS